MVYVHVRMPCFTVCLGFSIPTLELRSLSYELLPPEDEVIHQQFCDWERRVVGGDRVKRGPCQGHDRHVFVGFGTPRGTGTCRNKCFFGD